MRKLLIVTSSLFVATCIAMLVSIFNTETARAQSTRRYVTAAHQSSEEHRIKGIQALSGGSGIAFTSSKIFRTNDGGKNWLTISPTLYANEIIGAVVFSDGRNGLTSVGDTISKTLRVLRTHDGGSSWAESILGLREGDRAGGSLDRLEMKLTASDVTLKIPLESSSNFLHTTEYVSRDFGTTWIHFRSDNVVKPESAELLAENTISNESNVAGIGRNEDVLIKSTARRAKWILTNEGVCEGYKTSCVQVTRVYDISSGAPIEITPPEIFALTLAAREEAKFAETMDFLLPPGGSTRVSLNKGFDKCTAATSAQMLTWWNSSPYYDVNIYISGRNRGCSQTQLNATWVSTVSTQGWGLIPTVVGYQSPCSTCTTCSKHSSDPTQAELDGRGEADIAITDATNLGLLQGTVLYYDMERYDDTSGTGVCSTPTKAFLKGWTDRLKERGYVSGTYGSPTNAMNDWINIAQASRMDAVWLARWDGVASVWTYSSLSPTVPDTAWGNHQRIKQYQSPGNVTYGGVTFGIDNNIADGPVAGVQPKNGRADFDGDGKSDYAVWRPENGAWYVLNSNDFSFKAVAFGISTDILTPGDFDGDGRTDMAVWRPSNGVWYAYSRSIYSGYQFGADGDVPVPADFDGDGRTDIAVYRPSNGMWYIRNSFDSKGTSFRFEQFGASEDTPLPGDFDGDGKADLAVFRPSNGVWYVMGSTSGFWAVQFGMSSDKPVSADFDGDGKTDPAVYRAGIWHILGSHSGYYGFGFGLPDDKPAPGDFDGDGKSDVAVYRPSSGVWYILGSSQGFFAAPFGLSTDTPIQGAYIPKS